MAYDEQQETGREIPATVVPHRVLRVVPVLLIGALSMFGGEALAADDQAASTELAQQTNEALLRKMEAMEQRIKALEGQLQQRDASSAKPSSAATARPEAAPASAAPRTPQAAQAQKPADADAEKRKDIFGIVDSPVDGLKLGAYGEFLFGAQRNPDANGNWQAGADLARLVLLPTYAITDDIVFHAEIEFEHAGSGFDADDKLHGTAEIEQAYIDFKFREWMNFRSPGIDLVPVGYTNLYHEPTLFYSAKRPELTNNLIPTTWTVPATSVFGQLTAGLSYEFQVSSSLEDFGDDFANRTDGNGAPAGAFAPGIDGKDALSNARPPRGDFRQLNNTVGSAFRLAYLPSFVPGLAGSSSVYYTPNTTPRGSHDDFGNSLGNSPLTMFDSELRYRIPDSGFEFRGEFVEVIFGAPGNLRANNDSDPTNNVGKTMLGYSGEIAYHTKSGSLFQTNWDFVPFFRYTFEDLQRAGFHGTDPDSPTGAGRKDFYTTGLAVYPVPRVVLKLTYGATSDNSPSGARSDYVFGGVGFNF